MIISSHQLLPMPTPYRYQYLSELFSIYFHFYTTLSYIIFYSALDLFLFFFFSSRRRHTRFKCDWSSDVCSSDLYRRSSRDRSGAGTQGDLNDLWKFDGTNWTWVSGSDLINQPGVFGTKGVASRSEERRVGKECRSRWSPYH